MLNLQCILQVNLNMALVPMEERLKSKEKAWEAERRDLQTKIDESGRLVKIADERCRELDKRKSEMTEERCGNVGP